MWPFKNSQSIDDWTIEQGKNPLYFLRICFTPKQSVLNPNTVNYENYKDTQVFTPKYPHTSFELALQRARLIFKEGFWLTEKGAVFYPLHTIKEIRVGKFEETK